MKTFFPSCRNVGGPAVQGSWIVLRTEPSLTSMTLRSDADGTARDLPSGEKSSRQTAPARTSGHLARSAPVRASRTRRAGLSLSPAITVVPSGETAGNDQLDRT